MEDVKEALAQQLFGRSRKDPACVCCGSTAVNGSDFRDDLSRREFGISRMCQVCQDSIFGAGEENDIDHPF